MQTVLVVGSSIIANVLQCRALLPDAAFVDFSTINARPRLSMKEKNDAQIP